MRLPPKGVALTFTKEEVSVKPRSGSVGGFYWSARESARGGLFGEYLARQNVIQRTFQVCLVRCGEHQSSRIPNGIESGGCDIKSHEVYGRTGSIGCLLY